ncbi:hypothetical protein [Rhodopirellula bahusiensis]|uniref:Uncharacterized protein n=1 Tax=Rhodopirellula bahusiensis TaxID=2014065 RepID=A0A2G1VXI9_9BACT|nr:hypothetical protein [Rhodopirellula bahusiensis]PHQ31496.1 hypothetical protein CEE69_30820 [Rhodopirellula bahusiensis]
MRPLEDWVRSSAGEYVRAMQQLAEEQPHLAEEDRRYVAAIAVVIHTTQIQTQVSEEELKKVLQNK